MDTPEPPEPPSEPTEPTETDPSPELVAHADRHRRAERRAGLTRIVLGFVLVGITATILAIGTAAASSGLFVVAYGPMIYGLHLINRGIDRFLMHARKSRTPGSPALRWGELAGGAVLVALGCLLSNHAWAEGNPTGPREILLRVGPIVVGLALVGDAAARFLESRLGEDARSVLVLGYRSFVAWRYLLVYNLKNTVAARVSVVVGLGFALVVGLGWNDWLGPLSVGPVPEVAYGATAFLVLAIVWGFLRHSRPSAITFGVGYTLLLAAMVGAAIVAPIPSSEPAPFAPQIPDATRLMLQIFDIVKIVGAVLMGLAMFFGSIRGFFTFFTTVPIGGVWIGTAALVCVLAVMSGFETDLRDKILGSNAHIQVTREDGDFVNWREVKQRIDKIPGVVASTPYAVSEVVIAANNNGMNVLIKGIDPENVGNVTDLVADLEDPKALERLQPIVDLERGRIADPVAPPTGDDVVDPPPSDMPIGSDPIDFSAGSAGSAVDPADGSGSGAAPPVGAGSAGSGSAAPLGNPAAGSGSGSAAPPVDAGVATAPVDADIATAPPDAWLATDDYRVDIAGPPDDDDDFGGDARDLQNADVVDPPPPDLITSDEEPTDYSRPDGPRGLRGGALYANDVLDPSQSQRTLALPGILVGRELVKQTHLFEGDEVRVVSPLSDPSNPDATGTPIPFNRDYRVAGVFFTGMYEYDLKYVYVTLDSLQDFLDRGDAVDGIEVRIEDADDTARYVPTDAGMGLIREALGPGYRVADWRELNRNLFSALKLEKIAMFLVLGIVILVASFSIVGNLIMVVIEKARQIALLKTLGASDTGVMQLFAIQGLMIGLIGTVLGIATGLAGCWAGKRFGLPLNPDVYYIDRLPIHVDPASVVAAALAGVLISIAATFYPALLAARVRPAAGMRH